ncbi:hypothetical protein GCM10011505_21170 [Tistrella bauzanensis]|uniref:Lipoprotein n=1 Tax=Tistrella bauzanensis TaxID=657419 RepID=A0ABQ1IGE6_9PROT|nr:hypothetical protein [Tistrella bauzanensis]GGB39361.1 hypothetical protein GCM10011505_21170 [Tistrella bauzanensis]
MTRISVAPAAVDGPRRMLRHAAIAVMLALTLTACGKKGTPVPPMAVAPDGTVDRDKLPDYTPENDPRSLMTPGRINGPGLGVPPY